MEIKLAKSNDEERWDKFVLSHPDGSPYHLFQWKKAIEETYGHNCIYLFAELEKEIVGVMPIIHIHFSGIINDLISLPFCDVGNCIAKNVNTQDNLLKELIVIKERIGAKNLQIRGNLIRSDFVQSKFNKIKSEKVRMFLRLHGSSNDLFKSFKSKLRSQVMKAEKNGVVFSWGGVEDMDSAYRVFAKNMHALGSPVHSKSYFRAILTQYENRAKFGIVKYRDKTIGMGIILLSGKGVSIPWASTDRDFNRLGSNMLLYWNFLKYSADNGYEYFDFGRSSLNEGTYRFKKQWGAEPTPLNWYEDINRKEGKKIWFFKNKDKRKILSELWQKTPIKITNLIGPYLRKYISL